MSSGKKGKKTQGKKSKISLGEFLTDGQTGMVSQVQVAVPIKPRNWADECDDDEDDGPRATQMIALPTAPRATRLLNDDTVPHNPPFQAYISNLPYDLNDDDVYDFFGNMEISSLRLPRDDSDSGRLRGFGYVEFARRQDLIDALSIPEPMLNGRRIRIDFSSESDRNQRNNRNNRYNNDNYGGDSDRPMGNWRDAPRLERDQGQRRPYNSYNRDRGDREERGDSGRGDRYGSEGGSGAGGNWRMGDRPAQAAPSSPPSSRRGFERGPDRGGDRGGFRRGGDRSGDREGRREMAPPMERPKLVLQPRTLPLPEKPKPEPEQEGSERDISPEPKSHEDKENEEGGEPRPKPTPVPAAKLFGDAKPVDTAAKLREIEERMQEKERQRKAAAAEASAAAAEANAAARDEDEGKEKSDPSKDEAGEEHSEEKTAAPKTEASNWRVRSDNDQKERGPRRNDDYSNFSDNRDRDNRDRRDNRNMRDTRDNRDNRRDFNRPNDRDRGGFRAGDRGGEMNRRADDDRDQRDAVRPRDAEPRDLKPIEERMPKLAEPTGPNLSMQNTFEGLSADEVDD